MRALFISSLLALSCSVCALDGKKQNWNPSVAVKDADRDFAASQIRFCYIGGRASHAPGIPNWANPVVQGYPRLEVGPQGCDQDNKFSVRKEHARRYNECMWLHLSHAPFVQNGIRIEFRR